MDQSESHSQGRPFISLVAAVAENRTIGRNNQLLWRLPADLKFFRETTTGHPVIMGRRTFESIGRPLPKRRNIVLSREENYRPDGCERAKSPEEAVAMCMGESQMFVIGGAIIYQQFLPIADALILTELHHSFDGDAFFPVWNEQEWRLEWERQGRTDAANPYSYSFKKFTRLR